MIMRLLIQLNVSVTILNATLQILVIIYRYRYRCLLNLYVIVFHINGNLDRLLTVICQMTLSQTIFLNLYYYGMYNPYFDLYTCFIHHLYYIPPLCHCLAIQPWPYSSQLNPNLEIFVDSFMGLIRLFLFFFFFFFFPIGSF